MITYTTVEDFLRRYSTEEGLRLTQPGRNCLDCVDQVKIQEALQDAFEEINSYRTQRGDRSPWTNSSRLKQAEIVIARKNLSNYYDVDDPRYRDYKDIIDWLKQYAANKVSLEPEPTAPPLTSDIAWGIGVRRLDTCIYKWNRRWFRPQ